MKKTVKFLVIALMAVAAFACKKEPKPTVEPVFPKESMHIITPGESVELSLSANMDWELSMDSAASAWLWFDDGGVKAYKLKGEAGTFKVKICSVEKQNLELRVFEIAMTMAKQSKTVVTIEIPAEGRNISVFPAKRNAMGCFITTEDGEYEYESSEANALTLDWPADMTEYILPVKVAADFEWSIPETYAGWLSLSASSSEGEDTYIVLSGVNRNIPLEDTKTTISFVALEDGKKAFEIPLIIKGAKDIAYASCDYTTLEFNIPGLFNIRSSWSKEGCPVWLTGTSDSDIVIVEVNEGKLSYNTDSWLSKSVKLSEGSSASDTLQERVYHISASYNNGAERAALLLAIPGYILKSTDLSRDLFNADRSALKEPFAKYVFATAQQAGNTEGWGAITPLNSALMMAVKGCGINRSSTSEEQYSLNYNNWSSYEDATLMLQGMTNPTVTYRTKGGQESEFDSCVYYETVSSGQNCFRIGIDNFKDGYQTDVILREGSSEVVISCKLDTGFWPDVKYNEIYFVILDSGDAGMLPVGAELEELSSGEVYEKYKSTGAPIWKLTYNSTESVRNAMIYVPPFPTENKDAIQVQSGCEGWLSAEAGTSGTGMTYLHAKMNEKDSAAGSEGTIVLQGGGRVLFVLLCERAFMK